MKILKANVTWTLEITDEEEKEYNENKARMEKDTLDWLQDELGSAFKITLQTEVIEE